MGKELCFEQTVLGQPDINMQKMKLNPCYSRYTKIDSESIIYLNVREKNTKT